MNDALYTIAYLSRSRLRGDAEARRAELARLLDTARSHNARDEITGLLLFDQRCFAQILEGRREAVERIFARLCRDARHAEVMVLTRESLPTRDFAGWSMACMEGEAGLLDGFLGHRRHGVITSTAMTHGALLDEVRHLAGRADVRGFAGKPAPFDGNGARAN